MVCETARKGDGKKPTHVLLNNLKNISFSLFIILGFASWLKHINWKMQCLPTFFLFLHLKVFVIRVVKSNVGEAQIYIFDLKDYGISLHMVVKSGKDQMVFWPNSVHNW